VPVSPQPRFCAWHAFAQYYS